MAISTRLVIGGAIIVCVTGYMAYLGAASSWQYYLTVDECAPQARSLIGKRLRVSGRVEAGSLRIPEDRSEATFTLAGKTSRLEVACPGPLPDNLAEDMEVVVEGSVERAGFVQGRKVLTRCASKYESDQPDGTGQ